MARRLLAGLVTGRVGPSPSAPPRRRDRQPAAVSGLVPGDLRRAGLSAGRGCGLRCFGARAGRRDQRDRRRHHAVARRRVHDRGGHRRDECLGRRGVGVPRPASAQPSPAPEELAALADTDGLTGLPQPPGVPRTPRPQIDRAVRLPPAAESRSSSTSTTSSRSTTPTVTRPAIKALIAVARALRTELRSVGRGRAGGRRRVRRHLVGHVARRRRNPRPAHEPHARSGPANRRSLVSIGMAELDTVEPTRGATAARRRSGALPREGHRPRRHRRDVADRPLRDLAVARLTRGGFSGVVAATLLAPCCFSISAISATLASICAAASSGASLRFCATTSAPISWHRSLIFFWRRTSSIFSLPTAVRAWPDRRPCRPRP